MGDGLAIPVDDDQRRGESSVVARGPNEFGPLPARIVDRPGKARIGRGAVDCRVASNADAATTEPRGICPK